MAAAIVKVDTRKVRELFARLERVVRDPRRALVKVGTELVRTVRAAFGRQASPEGVRWRSLSQPYGRRKLKLVGPKKKLQFRGALLRGISGGALPGNKGAFVTTLPLPYARIHQRGGLAGRGRRTRIPARPYLPSAPLAEKIAVEVLDDELADAIKKAG